MRVDVNVDAHETARASDRAAPVQSVAADLQVGGLPGGWQRHGAAIHSRLAGLRAADRIDASR
jgi:hypothetical protein